MNITLSVVPLFGSLFSAAENIRMVLGKFNGLITGLGLGGGMVLLHHWDGFLDIYSYRKI